MSECMVFFQSDKCNLEDAYQSLVNYGLTVKLDRNRLLCFRDDSPQFTILLVTGEHIQHEAVEIARSTPQARAMNQCDARFEVFFDDLNQVLDEINTLMDVHGALQDASGGFLFTPWNGNLTEPWEG